MVRNLKGGKHKHTKRVTNNKKEETLVLAGDFPGSHMQ